MIQALPTSNHRSLPSDAVRTLRDGLATCRTSRGLSREARKSVSALCKRARDDGWSAEQLLIAVKEACYQSEEIGKLTTTSERDARVATVVTACITEFYTPIADG